MALQTQFAAQEGRGECFWTGADGVVDIDTDAPTGGDSFATADATNANANSPLAEVKHADIQAVGGPTYYTNNGRTPTSTVPGPSFPMAQDSIMPLRNSRALIKTLKFFVPTGTTLKVSWGA